MEATANYYQVEQMTPEETRKMLMKCKKAQLVDMLMELDRIAKLNRKVESIVTRKSMTNTKEYTEFVDR